MQSTPNPPSVDTDDPVVDIDNITKIYGSDDEKVVALDEVDIDINDGEFVSIVGPSGCGKTTLLHLTCGLLETTENNVYVDGVDVTSAEHENHKIGLVFQKPVLLKWRKVLKNILLPVEIMLKNDAIDGDMETYREKARELIDMVGLEGFEDAYPQELSGGMQQRVAICRSLIYEPDVLLMDEPFGALDAFTKQHLNDELLSIWNDTGQTIMFVTHDLDDAIYLSDRVVVLSSRPGEIEDIIEVDLPRPRDQDMRTSEKFQEYVTNAYQHFDHE